MRRPYTAKPAKVSTGDLRHRVVLCTAHDVVLTDGAVSLSRTAVTPVWAKITEQRGSLFSREGTPVQEDRERPSHCIVIRRNPAYDLSATAWIYEARPDAAPRWFKVLDTKEVDEHGIYGRFWELRCRVVERADMAAPPQDPNARPDPTLAVPLPAGVSL